MRRILSIWVAFAFGLGGLAAPAAQPSGKHGKGKAGHAKGKSGQAKGKNREREDESDEDEREEEDPSEAEREADDEEREEDEEESDEDDRGEPARKGKAKAKRKGKAKAKREQRRADEAAEGGEPKGKLGEPAFEPHPNEAIERELQKHARRMAQIDRIEAIGEEKENEQLVDKAKMLRKKESKRHERRMRKLRSESRGKSEKHQKGKSKKHQKGESSGAE